LFFNPYYGYRYLCYQNGHFSLVEPLPGLPEVSGSARPVAVYEGTTYRHFSTGEAVCRSVVGEFPWRVQRGEKAEARDYIAPPYVLSSERSGAEIVWARGVSMTQDEVVQAVGTPRRPFTFPRGVAPGEPNPLAAQRSWLGKA